MMIGRVKKKGKERAADLFYRGARNRWRRGEEIRGGFFFS